MIKNIQTIWKMLQTDYKKLAEQTCLKEFNLTSTTYFRQTWIYGGKIPEKDIESVLKIFQNVMRQQNEVTQKL